MKKAVVLLSGGLDSTTALALAKHHGFEVYAITFDYGQRHRIEIEAAKNIGKYFNVADHRIVTLDINQWGVSALTDLTQPIPTDAEPGIKSTYVPARNTIFLAVALGYAEIVGATTLYFSGCQTDQANFPDDSPEFVRAFETLANLATKTSVQGEKMTVATPFMQMDKAQTILLGKKLGVDYSMTLSCYQPSRTGLACGQCDPCTFRRAGFEMAGVIDPTNYY